MPDPSRAIWLAARLRHVVETLLTLQSDADAAGFSKPHTAISEAALQSGRAYEQLVQIASKPIQAPAREHLEYGDQELPF